MENNLSSRSNICKHSIQVNKKETGLPLYDFKLIAPWVNLGKVILNLRLLMSPSVFEKVPCSNLIGQLSKTGSDLKLFLSQ